jgi:hypothetical protein
MFIKTFVLLPSAPIMGKCVMSTPRGLILAAIGKLLLVGLVLMELVSCGISEDKQKNLNQELLRAGKEGRLEEVTRLLNNGVNVNAHDEKGVTPLIWAAANDHTEIMKSFWTEALISKPELKTARQLSPGLPVKVVWPLSISC